ncbi:seipin co-factor family protein [Aspergillus candidus]|uniref:Uncharacterized protein n=1 Tax=Aspergillus candidus TaxID=41067 RepID=A0A2I2F0D0_ASPCN|nr:hypothetical protein BDW47DRAFT_129355 [Aspergillus candidus]PLB34087.1 hypothetical protein BDW47DRAFT_129355 [Aspergillus candidus]
MAIELDNSTTTTTPDPGSDHPLSSNNNNNTPTYDNNNDPPSLLTAAHTILTTHFLPPETQSTLLKTILTHPYWTTFLLAQFLCSVIPIALFLLGAVVAASVAVTAFTCLAGLVLIPVLIGTTVLGVGAWGCGWVVIMLGRWAWGAFVVNGNVSVYSSLDELSRSGVVKKEKEGDGGVYGNGVQNGKDKDGGN